MQALGLKVGLIQLPREAAVLCRPEHDQGVERPLLVEAQRRTEVFGEAFFAHSLENHFVSTSKNLGVGFIRQEGGAPPDQLRTLGQYRMGFFAEAENHDFRMLESLS